VNIHWERESFLLCIQKVPGSNIGRGTDYPEVSRSFPQAIQENDRMVPRSGHSPSISHTFLKSLLNNFLSFNAIQVHQLATSLKYSRKYVNK
jgi:hypothetical protein